MLYYSRRISITALIYRTVNAEGSGNKREYTNSSKKKEWPNRVMGTL